MHRLRQAIQTVFRYEKKVEANRLKTGQQDAVVTEHAELAESKQLLQLWIKDFLWEAWELR